MEFKMDNNEQFTEVGKSVDEISTRLISATKKEQFKNKGIFITSMSIVSEKKATKNVYKNDFIGGSFVSRLKKAI